MSGTANIQVSIGLPTYNGVRDIRRAIESALRQSHGNIELIISDDASKDATPQICAEYAEQDSRIRFIRQYTNIGLTANWNAVLRASSADYFMWLSDDDWLDEHYVESCLRYLLEHGDHVVVCGMSRFFVGDERVFDGEIVQAVEQDPAARIIRWYREVIHAGMVYGLFRRSALGDGFPMPPVLAEDQYIVAAALCQGKAATLKDTFLNRSRTGTSATSEGIMKLYGLRPRSDLMLELYKGRSAAQEILRNPAYKVIPTARRRVLAVHAMRLLWLRNTADRLRWRCRRLIYPVKQSFIGDVVRRARRR